MAISATLSTIADAGNTLTKFRALARKDASGSDDAANSFKADALKLTTDKATFTSSTVKADITDSVGAKIAITYNNSTGVITWGGKKLNLTGFDPRTEPTLYIQQGIDNTLNIFRDSTGKGFVLDLDTGSLQKDANGDYVTVSGFNTAQASLIVNNSSSWGGGTTTGTSGNDVIINRQGSGIIDAGGGNDQIFNFGSGAVNITGGAGNDALYTIGNSAGVFDLSSSTDAYIKTLGNMTDSTVKLGTGRSIFDATGYTLKDLTVENASGTSTALIAKSIAATDPGKTMTLKADMVGVDVSTLSGNLALGAGVNSLVADTVTGATVTSSGADSFQFGTVSGNAKIDGSAATAAKSSVINVTGSAKDTSFLFGAGTNMLNALGKTLTSVDISDKDGAQTGIQAGAIAGTSAKGSTIALKGDAGKGNSITVSGGINYATIDTGKGPGTITAASLSNSTVRMGGGGATAQSLSVKGKIDNTTVAMDTSGDNTVTAGAANKMTYTGGAGADNVTISGAVNASSFFLDDGLNTFSAVNNSKGQAITDTNIFATGATTIKGGAYTSGAGENSISLTGTAASHSVSLTSIGAKAGGSLTMTLGGDTNNAAQSLTVTGAVKSLKYMGSNGNDIISTEGAISNSIFTLNNGTNSLIALKGAAAYQAMNDVDITSGDGDTTIKAGAYTASKAQSGAPFTNNKITLGNGVNTVQLASVTGKNVTGGTVGLDITLLGASSKTQTLNILGAAKNINYKGSTAGDDNVTINGAVSNSTFALGGGTANTFKAFKTNAGGTEIGQALTDVNITATSGNNTVFAGAYTANGVVANTINLGNNGINSVTLGSIASKGNEGLNISLTGAGPATPQTLLVKGAANKLNYMGGAANDLVRIEGSVSNSEFDLGDGENTFTAAKQNAAGTDIGQALNNVNIDAVGATNTVFAGAYTAGVGGVDNSIALRGTGANSLTLSSVAGKNSSAGLAGLKVSLGGASTADQTLTILGAASNLKYTGAAGKDLITIKGAVSESTFGLAAGDDSFLAENDKGVKQKLTNVGITSASGATTITAGAYTVTDKATPGYDEISLGGTAANNINLNSIAGGKTVNAKITNNTTGAGTVNLSVAGAVSNLAYSGGVGVDNIVLNGATSNSSFNLGNGDNTLDASRQTLTSVNITGGAGKDIIKYGAYKSNKGDSNFIDLGGGAENKIEIVA